MKAKFLAAVLAASTTVVSGAALPGQRHSETGDPLLDYKLRSSRAEQAHKDVQRAADELRELAASLAKRVADRGALDADDEKALGRIRKLAKRVRSAMGGTGDPEMLDPPATLRGAAVALADRGEAFDDQIHKSTRFETNARLIALAGEIIFLTEMLKQFR